MNKSKEQKEPWASLHVYCYFNRSRYTWCEVPLKFLECGNSNGKKQNGIGVYNFVISKIGFSPFFPYLILVHLCFVLMEAVLKVKTNQFLCVWEREYGGTVKDFPRSVYLWRYSKVPVTDYVKTTVNYKTFRRLPCFLTASVSFPSSKAPSFSVSLCCFAEMPGTCIADQRPNHEHCKRTLSILFCKFKAVSLKPLEYSNSKYVCQFLRIETSIRRR